jgi:hypothetical protein
MIPPPWKPRRIQSERAARVHSDAVTFVSTPRNVARLSAISLELSVCLRVVVLDLPPQVEGLLVGAESTVDLSPEKVELLKEAFDDLVAPFASFVVESPAGVCRARRTSGAVASASVASPTGLRGSVSGQAHLRSRPPRVCADTENDCGGEDEEDDRSSPTSRHAPRLCPPGVWQGEPVYVWTLPMFHFNN